MLAYVIIFLLGAIAMLVFRRLIGTVLRFLIMGAVIIVSGRLTFMADDRLAQPSWVTGGIIGGITAFVVVGLLSYAVIYHALVAADERRDIDRARETAKRRRLW